MSTQTTEQAEPRIPLTRERVLGGAVEVADQGGLESLTMRNLAAHLGVEAMSLYYHVQNKEALLDGVVEVVVGEILEDVSRVGGPSAKTDWKTAMRNRILAAREVLLRHKWAPEVIESRTDMSPAIGYYYEGMLRIFREGGFSYDLAHHAFHALGSRALGFNQELFQPDEAGADDDTAEMLEQMASEFPYMVAMLDEISHEGPETTLGWCDDQTEFEFGLDILLNGLEQLNRDGWDPTS